MLRALTTCVFSWACVFSWGCGEKKATQESPDESGKACKSIDDCAPSEACLDQRCASMTPTAILTNPSKAVTPKKVKAEIERINEQAAKRRDELLGDDF